LQKLQGFEKGIVINMEKIKIVTDSCSDISVNFEKEHECLSVMNFKVTFGDYGFTSRIDITSDQFYEMLSQSETVPTTSQLTVFEFLDIFEKALDEGYTHILVTLINKTASATYANAERAIQEFMAEHSDSENHLEIRLIDSRSYTGAYGYPVSQAVLMAEMGKSFEEIVSYVQDAVNHMAIYFAPYTLKYAKKSGRIPGAVAVIGEAMGIKPIMRIWDHEIKNSEMVRGEKKLISKLADKVVSEIEEGSPYNIVYGNVVENYEQMKKEMTDRLGYPPVGGYQINPIVSSHAGPHVVGVIFRTKKLSDE
jgi:DegV family protein with EDD domain